MKQVFRVRSWGLEYEKDGPILAAKCTTSLVGVTICRVLANCFPGIDATSDDSRWGLAALDGGHRIRLGGSLPNGDELRAIMNLLTEILTVCDSADVSHCLGVYRVPSEDIPADDWPYTEIGRLVHDAKYMHNGSSASDVAKEMTLVVAAHPALRAADAIVSTPSSGRHFDGPVLWRSALARQFGFEEVGLARTRAVRPQKDIQDRQERIENQHESMSCEDGLDGKKVIVLDDLYMDGATMNEAIRALRSAGASCVFGLCGVKTARGTQGGIQRSLLSEGEEADDS